jgi:homogentisate 1,2-dioxygenase
MTASAFIAPRHVNKRAWLYRVRPAVAHRMFRYEQIHRYI